VPDEENQLPVVLILAAPPRHAGESNSVLDDEEQLAVSQALRLILPQVGSRRIQPGVDEGLPALLTCRARYASNAAGFSRALNPRDFTYHAKPTAEAPTMHATAPARIFHVFI
jgi:hypothetical protein